MTEGEKSKSLITSLNQLYRHFAENTNLHGCLRTAIRTPFRRTVWALMFFAVVGWSVYQFWSILQDFYTYPVTTSVTFKNDRMLMFPAVTVCNNNRLRRSLIPESLRKEMELFSRQENLTESKMQYFINEFLRKSSIEEKRKAWHSLPDMLVDCTFNTKQCSERNFSLVEGTVYGNCYTFNNDKESPLSATKAGPHYGLVLELNLEQDEYLPLTNLAGFKVIIHDPGEKPFLEDGGILVGPGAETSIGIGQTKIDRLPQPYGACIEDRKDNDYSLYADWNFLYTQIGCIKSCYQITLFELCGCCDPNLPCVDETITRITDSPGNGDIRFCNFSDIQCIHAVDTMYLSDSMICLEKCPPACQKNIYATYISSAAWPAQSYFNIFLKKINNTKLQNLIRSGGNYRKYVQNNFARVEIYYNNLELIEYVAVPSYTWNKVLGDIGGQMGLWMGFSILAGMEVAELFFDTCVLLAVHLYRRLMIREIQTSKSLSLPEP